MSNILSEIVAHKRGELIEEKAAQPIAELRDRVAGLPLAPGFAEALRNAPMGLIAEAKRRSPSAGPIREPFDAAAIALTYERAGAQACSVLMDEKYFGGGAADFQAARATVDIPLLYKEFVVLVSPVWVAAPEVAAVVANVVGIACHGLAALDLPAVVRVGVFQGLNDHCRTTVAKNEMRVAVFPVEVAAHDLRNHNDGAASRA